MLAAAAGALVRARGVSDPLEGRGGWEHAIRAAEGTSPSKIGKGAATQYSEASAVSPRMLTVSRSPGVTTARE